MIDPSSSPVLRCLITDDEPIAIRGIINYINQLDFLTVTATCPSAPEAAKILKNEDIDLMFLDINMPHLSGLEFLESLETAPMTIFTTAYSEYALEGYRLNVVDYLLKPIAFNRFFRLLPKLRISSVPASFPLPAKPKQIPCFMYVRTILFKKSRVKISYMPKVCKTT